MCLFDQKNFNQKRGGISVREIKRPWLVLFVSDLISVGGPLVDGELGGATSEGLGTELVGYHGC